MVRTRAKRLRHARRVLPLPGGHKGQRRIPALPRYPRLPWGTSKVALLPRYDFRILQNMAACISYLVGVVPYLLPPCQSVGRPPLPLPSHWSPAAAVAATSSSAASAVVRGKALLHAKGEVSPPLVEGRRQVRFEQPEVRLVGAGVGDAAVVRGGQRL